MSDSNIYMALAQSDCFPWSDRWESERKQEERVEAGGERDRGRLLLQRGGWSISDAICPPRYFRIRWSPSPSSSGWERGGTLHSAEPNRMVGHSAGGVMSSPLTVLIKKQLSSGKL